MRPVVARTLAVLAVLAAGATAGGCATPAPPQAAPSSAAGTAAPAGDSPDVAFLQDMVAHHQQALTLTALVPGRSTDPRLAALAEQVAGRQRSEIAGFQAQLLQWEVPTPDPVQAVADLPGMVDQATVDRLQGLRGAAFDTAWLQSMIAQRRGALAMTRTEVANGRSPDIIGIARSVLAAEQADLDRMSQLLEAR